MGNIIPIIPVAIEGWRKRGVAKSATIMRTTAPQRSNRGARLKKAHHTTTANQPKIPPTTAISKAPGTTLGRPNLTSTCSVTATTPGHSRSAFRGGGSPVFAMVISERYSRLEPFVPFFSPEAQVNNNQDKWQ